VASSGTQRRSKYFADGTAIITDASIPAATISLNAKYAFCKVPHFVPLHKRKSEANSEAAPQAVVFDRIALKGQHARNQGFAGHASISLRVCRVASPALKPIEFAHF